jgi:hypothetical protein
MEGRLSSRGPDNVAIVARRLLLFATTAATLALAGCGDSGEASEDSAAGAGALASDLAGTTTIPTGSTW